MMRVQALVFILLIYKVLSTDKCQEDFILRYHWINQTKVQHICCKKVSKNCEKGFYVKTCTTDLGIDECIPCPGNTWLVDETNSTSVHECVLYRCATGAKRVNYLPKTGCNLPCICDLDWDYYGSDSCNCRLFEGTCPPETTLTMNGTCLSYKDAEQVNDLKPAKDVVNIPIIVKLKVNGTKENGKNQTRNDFDIYKWIITGVSVIGLMVIAFAVWMSVRWKCCINYTAASQRDVENQNLPNKGNRSPSTGTDSGVSLTTSSSASGLPVADQQQNLLEQSTSGSKSHEQTDVQQLSPEQIPLLEQLEMPGLSKRLLNIESNDENSAENQTAVRTINKNDLKLNLIKLSKEQSAFREQTPVRFELGDQELHGKFQRSNGIQVAAVSPFNREMVTKETDKLLNAATVSIPVGEIIQQNRPPTDNNIPTSQRLHTQEYIDVQHSFGSGLQMSSL